MAAFYIYLLFVNVCVGELVAWRLSFTSFVCRLVLNQIFLPPLASTIEEKSRVFDQTKHSAANGAVS